MGQWTRREEEAGRYPGEPESRDYYREQAARDERAQRELDRARSDRAAPLRQGILAALKEVDAGDKYPELPTGRR